MKKSAQNITWQLKTQNGVKAIAKPLKIAEIEVRGKRRLLTSIKNLIEYGGGIVPGSITHIGGEPGIGKSTLLLQIALA